MQYIFTIDVHFPVFYPFNIAATTEKYQFYLPEIHLAAYVNAL